MNATFKSAQSILLEPYGLGIGQLEQVLGSILTHQVDYADLYFQYSRAEGWSLEEGQVKSGSFHIEQGVGVRAVSGERTAFAYSDDIQLSSLQEIAKATRSIAHSGRDSSVSKLTYSSLSRQLYPSFDPLLTLADDKKVLLLEKIEKIAKSLDPRITQVMASLAAQYEVVLVARSDGHMATDIRPLVRLSLQVIAEQNGLREQGSGGGGGRFGYEYFTDEILEDYAKKAVHQALTNLDAKPAPAGLMPVVLGPGWPGILLHEAIGHGLEGDFNRKGSSAFSGRIGQRVASPGVTVLDDGTIANRRGSLNCDDEGNPTQATVLIENGILKGYLQDSLNARLMDMPVTGNARRESFAHLPMPRMTNTYMLNGNTPAQDIIASVEKGIYAVNFGGGQVDITSGKFVFSAAEAWMIENGKLTYPVKGATLIGNGPDVLTKVSMIGNDMTLDPGVGVCGKEGQSVPVGVGQPTLRIDGLTVGGTI
ncbi:metalloprotease TldD [Ferrovum sp. JA12]|uniref:metalloprotease TldD n=1 Tax=Ferrovum sp. JA12 TaxID=1356299 RepID=UPI00071512A6|nr:metalloprotease TldD [Ferrovum sp. JA12]KRH78861.1 metalloprotease TldD [Ferrovum sp. JA12]HQT81644.1 metalloprotease TldD [Ferrovaceae bacterium]HQU06533.1 metalloprotease TldD [Ferrovaceae bacterium]